MFKKIFQVTATSPSLSLSLCVHVFSEGQLQFHDFQFHIKVSSLFQATVSSCVGQCCDYSDLSKLMVKLLNDVVSEQCCIHGFSSSAVLTPFP